MINNRGKVWAVLGRMDDACSDRHFKRGHWIGAHSKGIRGRTGRTREWRRGLSPPSPNCNCLQSLHKPLVWRA